MSPARIPAEISHSLSRVFGRLGRESVMALAADGAAVALLAGGFSYLFFSLTGLDTSLSASIWTALACTLASILLTRRWWILPSLLFLGFATGTFLLLRQEDPSETIATLTGLARMGWWILTGYTAPTPAILPYLTWLSVWAITLPLLLIVRKLFNMLAIALGTAAVFMSLWIAGLSPSIEAMALCIAGLASLFPRQFALSVNRAAGGREPLARGAMQVLAVPISILCIVLALGFVPENTASWRLRILVNSVADVKDLLDLWDGDVRPHEEFTIANLGWQPLGSRLGGPIQPSNREYLRIRTEVGSLHLRAGTRDTYTGFNWLDSQLDPQFRFGSFLWRGTQNEAFDTGRPAGADRSEFTRQMMQEVDVRITHIAAGQPFFFTGSRTERIRISRSYDAIPYFNIQGELFSYQSVPVQGEYAIRADFFNRFTESFDARMLEWENRVEADPPEWIEAVEARYLQLPENFPESVVNTAADIAGQGTPYERAMNLQAFFRDDFTYTLTPVVPPADVDFVEHFLQTREGYCVYFATAMTVMARTQGLPSRYVEGFLSPSPKPGALYSITGKMAHAWVEIYFDGIGWVLFDPTPTPDPNAPVVTPSITPPIEEPSISPEPTMFPLTPIVPYDPDDEPTVSAAMILFMALFLMAPPAFWMTVSIRKRLLVSRYRLSSVRRRFANRERQMAFYHSDILRQLACLDIQPDPGETLSGFARRADRRIAIDQVRIEDATDIFLRRKYGLLFPTGEDIARQSSVHKALEDYLQVTLTPNQYLRKRIFGLQSLNLPEGSIET